MSFTHFPRAWKPFCILVVLGGLFSSYAKESAPDKPAEKSEEASVADKKLTAEAEQEEVEEAEEAEDGPETEEEDVVKARPVSPDPVQIYGWRERIFIDGFEGSVDAKLDSGAYTSSIHAEEKELFERDGKKWMRFIMTEPRKEKSPRVRIEAPLVRIARVKNPGGKSDKREVVKLTFKIGDKKIRADFTLNDRSNMLSAVLIGRTTIRELGWIDCTRTNLADQKILH